MEKRCARAAGQAPRPVARPPISAVFGGGFLDRSNWGGLPGHFGSWTTAVTRFRRSTVTLDIQEHFQCTIRKFRFSSCIHLMILDFGSRLAWQHIAILTGRNSTDPYSFCDRLGGSPHSGTPRSERPPPHVHYLDFSTRLSDYVRLAVPGLRREGLCPEEIGRIVPILGQ
jgi:hypothetical protein